MIAIPVYKEVADKEKLLRSIKNNVVAILNANSEVSHKKDLLDICIWQITEIDGKFNTRYRSEGAMVEHNFSVLRHEHVNQRKYLINRVLTDKDVNSFVAMSVACLVTKEEHELLSHSFIGWDRYKNAEINVYDLLNQQWLDL
jgi:hypothetical protein